MKSLYPKALWLRHITKYLYAFIYHNKYQFRILIVTETTFIIPYPVINLIPVIHIIL